jgi:hypothetical protein
VEISRRAAAIRLLATRIRCKISPIGGGVRITSKIYTPSTGFPRPTHRWIHRMI